MTPKDHREAIAIFRSEIVGGLVRRELDHGELAAALKELSQQRFRPPDSPTTRCYSVPTLQRWYYAYRNGGLEALTPQPRSDGGRGRMLRPEQIQLLLDVRREYRSASVPVILRTLERAGQLEPRAISAPTVRRLYRDHGLDRVARRDAAGPRVRLRWQADAPGALWHADVCHGAPVALGEKRKPLRIHGILDDASRYVVALEGRNSEREVDMLDVLVRALRKHGAPDALYLDNGSTYRGEILRVACARLGINLLHARPYDPQARGKMERFWSSLRSGCLNFLADDASLHDVNVRLWAWIDQHYHVTPHSSLMGRSPTQAWNQGVQHRPVDHLDEQRLRTALTVRERRRVRRDSTLSVAGQSWELDEAFLTGRVVTVAYCMLDRPLTPWVELGERRLGLHLVDPIRNAHRHRQPVPEPTPKTSGAFNPADVLLDHATGRRREENSP